MRVLVTGAGGCLGQELARTRPVAAEGRFLSRAELDITDAAAVARRLAEHTPDVVINAAAYTDVEKAEAEPERATQVNAAGAGILARGCREAGARLIHVSSDLVFDGTPPYPYRPDAPVAPLSAYGRSKAAGEHAVLALDPAFVVVRSSWFYSACGRNLVKVVLAQCRAGRTPRVVVDQVGTPTCARSLADVLWRLAARRDIAGLQHYAGIGAASWYDVAQAACTFGHELGLLKAPVAVVPIRSDE